jgi:hypothetical protein
MAVAVIPGVFAMSRNAGPMTIILDEPLFGLDRMAGLASFACEGMTRRDIAVLRVGAEDYCGQSDRERHSTSCLAHGHSPWRLLPIEMLSIGPWRSRGPGSGVTEMERRS